MTKRVFFVECSGPVWHSISRHCLEQAGWLPALWTASPSDARAVAAINPDVHFIPSTDAALGLPAANAPWELPPLEPTLLKALAFNESIALHMMDRMDPGCGAGFTHDERRRHYHALLRYWLGAIHALRPDLIVFSIAPHIVFDYVLYALAKQLGIPTLMFERLGLPGWVFPVADYDQGSLALRSWLDAHTAAAIEDIPAPFQPWLRNAFEGGSAVPANFARKLERYQLNSRAELPSLAHSVLHEVKRALVLFKRSARGSAPNSYLRSARFPHGRAGHLETFLSRLKGILFKRNLTRLHDSLVRQPDDNEKFVFLALHYQPERATVPMGGAFGDQSLIVDLLASALPPGWKLYVKEHPWQLQPFGRGEVQRSAAFYAQICRHPLVVLLPRGVPSAQMVRAAQAVATVTGSVGWDALCAGVPVLLFGAAWYQHCPGVLQIEGRAALAGHLATIAQGEKPRPEEVTAFVSALSKVCVPGVLEASIEAVDDLDEAALASGMAGALIEAAQNGDLPASRRIAQ